MFVSIVVDPGSIDSARALVDLLVNLGFKKIQRSCWENAKVNEDDLSNLKKEIDRVTDYYDIIRLYQFPINGMFVITELKEKKWRKCQIASGAEKSGQNKAAGAKTS